MGFRLEMRNVFKDKQAIPFRLIELAALLSVVLLAISTRWGPGVAGDATIYITSARSLVEGHGLGLPGPQGEFRLLPYFPPFFSLVLGLFGFLRIDMVEGARWLNILCFAALIYLAGGFTYRFSKGKLKANGSNKRGGASDEQNRVKNSGN